MTSAFSCQNSVSLWAASFCTPWPNLPVTPSSSWLPTFSFQSCTMKQHLFWVLVLEGLIGLHKVVHLLQHYWSGHRLGLLWYWMICLGNEQRSFCHFCNCIQVLHFRLSCWLWGLLPFLLRIGPTNLCSWYVLSTSVWFPHIFTSTGYENLNFLSLW